MSRSFVKSWATVVTIMALACFAFVQPMPESPRGVVLASDAGSPNAAPGAAVHLNEAPPLLDTAFSSKTFSSVAILPVMLATYLGGSRPNAQAFTDGKIPIRAPEPLIRPG